MVRSRSGVLAARRPRDSELVTGKDRIRVMLVIWRHHNVTGAGSRNSILGASGVGGERDVKIGDDMMSIGSGRRRDYMDNTFGL